MRSPSCHVRKSMKPEEAVGKLPSPEDMVGKLKPPIVRNEHG